MAHWISSALLHRHGGAKQDQYRKKLIASTEAIWVPNKKAAISPRL